MILTEKINVGNNRINSVLIKCNGRNWVKIRKAILALFHYQCQKCKITFTKEQCDVSYSKRVLEIHHIIPKYENGLDSYENFTVLCRKCHKFYTSQTKRKQILEKKRTRKIDEKQRRIDKNEKNGIKRIDRF